MRPTFTLVVLATCVIGAAAGFRAEAAGPTPANASIVRVLGDPGDWSWPVSAEGLATRGNRAFFVALEYGGGIRLWTSDGTSVGTRIAAVPEGLVTGDAEAVGLGFHFGQYLFATIADGRSYLWASDGTEAGTRRLGRMRGGAFRHSVTHGWARRPGFFLWIEMVPNAGGLPTFELVRWNGAAREVLLESDRELAIFDIGGNLIVEEDTRPRATRWITDGTLEGTWALGQAPSTLDQGRGFELNGEWIGTSHFEDRGADW